MMAFMGDVVVLGLRAEVSSLGQAGFTKKIERAVNGCESQVRILASQLMVHGFRRDVLLLKERVEDQFSLARKLQLVLSEVLLEDSHFFGMLWHHNQTAS